MLRRSLILLFALVCLVCPRTSVHADLLFDRFRDLVESLRTQANVPGLAAVIVGSDQVVWEQAFGRSDIDRSFTTRTDTPFHIDGLTQLLTSVILLSCEEQGHLSLDDTLEHFKIAGPDANLTIRQVLTHTSGPPDNLTFSYKPERLASLAPVVRACTEDSYRENLSTLFDRLAMTDSVPGPDATTLTPPAEGIPTHEQIVRYADVLERLAIPYAVDSKGRATRSRYQATTLTPSTGIIASALDLAEFDLALKNHVLLDAETIERALQPSHSASGLRLPHGIGWFVQVFNGETIAWQFGVGENASSSLVVWVPGRDITLILTANSDGLVKPFALPAGDLTASPFGRVFLELFVR